MSQNPYQPNAAANQTGVRPPNTGAIAAPGIALLVIGILNILHSIYSLAINILFPQMVQGQMQGDIADAPPAMQDFVVFMTENSSIINISVAGLYFILGLLVAFGGYKLFKLESWGMGMTAAIIAVIPCTGVMDCCLVEIGIGIWALVVLLQASTKAAFN